MVGFISDLHLDVNKIDETVALETLKKVVVKTQLSYLILVGDTYNDFARTQKFVARLNETLVGKAQVSFLAGNHDMARHATEETVEAAHPNYLHKNWLDLPDSDVRVLGHNGWYDYSLAPTVTVEAGWNFHQGLYFDRVIPQSETDIERTNRALHEMNDLLLTAKAADKKVIVATHFVPIKDDLHQDIDARFTLVNAMLGSARMGDYLKQQAHVIGVVFGHQHVNPPIRYYRGTPFVNVALGIKKRPDEWLSQDLFTAIEEKMTIFAK